MWLKSNLVTRYNSEAGFAMPLALGLGLVMIIVVASTIGRSQSDRSTTISQKETYRALGVSEAGLLRIQLFLDRHKLLTKHNLDKWAETLDLLPTEQANCGSINLPLAKQKVQVFKNHTWIDLDSNDRTKGRYRVIDYQYQSGIGKLTLTGEVDPYNSNNNSSNSTLTVEILLDSETAQITPPTLWAKTFNLSPTQQINGQIRAAICPQITDALPSGVVGISSTNIAQLNSQPTGQIIADIFTAIPQVKVAPNNAILIPAITTTIELPRPASSDIPDAKGEYHYLVDIDSPTSEHSIKLTDIDQININLPANQKINLYLKGNIDFCGSQVINLNSSHPNLRIYGGDRTLKLTIKDNAAITAFIHAPLADAQSTNAINPRPNSGITGAVWVKSWDSATSSGKIPIIRSGNWSDLGINKTVQPPQLSQLKSWARVESR